MFPSAKHFLRGALALLLLFGSTFPAAQAHFGPFIRPPIHPFWGGFGFGPRFIHPYPFGLASRFAYPHYFGYLGYRPFFYGYRPFSYGYPFLAPSYGFYYSGASISSSSPTYLTTPGLAYPLTPPQPPPNDQQEPTYQGKTVKEWIKALKNWDSKVRGQAANALAHLGPKAHDAIADLIDALKDSDPMVRVEAAGALAAIGTDAIRPLIEALKNSDKYERMGAALALGYLGPKAEKDGTEALEKIDPIAARKAGIP